MPAIKYIVDNHPHVILYLFVPDFFKEFARRSVPNLENIYGFSDKSKFNDKYPCKAFSMHRFNNLGTHMTIHAFTMLCNTHPEDLNAYNYLELDTSDQDLSKFNLPRDYVVITTGFTAPVREFLPEYINEISDYIVKKGYIPVYLGKKETPNGAGHIIKGEFREEINFSNGVNLIDQTSLLESREIIKHAKVIIGLDNGLLHIAGTCDVPIVGGFTSVNPIHRMPYRSGQMGKDFYPVVPNEDLACRFCQSNFQFTYNFKFTHCYYNDYKCLKMLSPDLYINQLEKIL